MILIGATSARTAEVAYQILIVLYAYNIVILIGFFTAGGLLYVRFFGEEGQWVERSGFKPWGGPTAAILYTAMTAFFLVAQFVPPNKDSPFRFEVKWFIIPTVGLSFLVLGYFYYLGLMYMVPRYFKKGKVLVADREAVIVRENGEYVQYLEIVDATWEARSGPPDNGDSEMALVDRHDR